MLSTVELTPSTPFHFICLGVFVFWSKYLQNNQSSSIEINVFQENILTMVVAKIRKFW